MSQGPFRVLHFRSWRRFRDVIESPEYDSWAFRGHSNADWPLYTSLSRYLIRYQIHRLAWQQQESRILRIFKRKAHLLLDHLPEENDSFQWLALMQHHGAPTRLLDFTWSPLVATFFALEQATGEAAVWALFPPGLTSRPVRTVRASQRSSSSEVAPWVAGGYEKHFLPNTRRIVVAGEPLRMNQRLIAQSGTFVVPGILDLPIEQIARSSSIVKFVLDARLMRRSAISALYRMNMNNATLFPGLDGLARSLGYEMEIHWAFDPITMKKRKGFYID